MILVITYHFEDYLILAFLFFGSIISGHKAESNVLSKIKRYLSVHSYKIVRLVLLLFHVTKVKYCRNYEVVIYIQIINQKAPLLPLNIFICLLLCLCKSKAIYILSPKLNIFVKNRMRKISVLLVFKKVPFGEKLCLESDQKFALKFISL